MNINLTDISISPPPKMHRFTAPPTAREVIEVLSKRPQDAVVVIGDGANDYGSVLFITEAYEAQDKDGTEVVLLGVE